MTETFIFNPTTTAVVITIIILSAIALTKVKTTKIRAIVVLSALVLVVVAINTQGFMSLYHSAIDDSIYHIVDSSEYQEEKYDFKITKETNFKEVWENLYSEVEQYKGKLEDLGHVEGLVHKNFFFNIDVNDGQLFNINRYTINTAYSKAEVFIHGRENSLEISITDDNIIDKNYNVPVYKVMNGLDNMYIPKFVDEFYKQYSKKELVTFVRAYPYNNETISLSANRTYVIDGNNIVEKTKPFELNGSVIKVTIQNRGGYSTVSYDIYKPIN